MPNRASLESADVCPRAAVRLVASVVLLVAVSVPAAAQVTTHGSTIKVGFYNIQSGKGEPGLPGHPTPFADTSNCTDTSLPLNAWGIGFVQQELTAAIGSDPAVIALGLAEAWSSVCASAERVRQALGWKARSDTNNGLGMVARHGFSGAVTFLKLDTSQSTDLEPRYVAHAKVCIDAACAATLDVFVTHMMATGSLRSASMTTQVQQLLSFMAQQAGTRPRVILGDFNLYEEYEPTCGTASWPASILDNLRSAGYKDAWRTLRGTTPGYTGMTNRRGCGTPEGSTYKRIDYSWSRDLTPVSVKLFGVPPPGDPAPSDHYGILAEYSFDGSVPPPDTTGPDVALTAPASGAKVSGPVTLSASATDVSGVARVEFLVDGAALGSDSSPPYTASWTTTSYPNGAHTLQARAFDSVGNSAVSTLSTVTVENAADPGPIGPGDEVVMYASLAAVAGTRWQFADDATAASGRLLYNANLGATKASTALAAPADYADLTFRAEKGRAYRLWIRGRAAGNGWANDSVFVQFSDSVDEIGAPRWRIGTTSSTTVQIEEGLDAVLSGWGWADNGYGGAGPLVYFAETGDHTVRLQIREDGISIDQVVLSAVKYLTLAPGAARDDNTILPPSPAAPTEPPPDVTPPQIAIQGPVADAIVNGMIALSATASDAGGVARVEFLIDGALTATDALEPFEASWDTTTVPDGVHSLQARAYDRAGNAAASEPRALTVANTPQTPGAIISVPEGGDLQAALDAALPGDTIVLAPGATYVGNFELPVHGGTSYVTLRTGGNDSRLPAPSTRVTPAHAPYLAKLQSPNSAPALKTRPRAAFWRVELLEFLPTRNSFYDIIALGHGSQTSLDEVPHHLTFDRVYIHGDVVMGQKRGIALNSAETTIVNSHISEIKAAWQDSQAICGWNGPGPFRIENNYLEAAGDVFLLGGTDPTISGLVPSDLLFRGNTLTRPVSWRKPILSPPARVTAAPGSGAGLPAGTYTYVVTARRAVSGGNATSAVSAEVSATVSDGGQVTIGWDPVPNATEYRVYGRAAGAQTMYWSVTSTRFTDVGAMGTAAAPPTSGTVWQVKNIFELKNTRRAQIDYNLMENNWKQAQNGFAVLFTPRNSGGLCTWCIVEDVTFEYNVVRHIGAGINLHGIDPSPPPTLQANGFRIRHNVFSDMGSAWGGNGYFLQLTHMPRNLTIDHNTIVSDDASRVLYVSGPPIEGFVFTNNVARHGEYGIYGSGGRVGTAAIEYYFPDGVVRRNVLAGGQASMYPPDNQFPSVAEFEAQFVDYAGQDFALVRGTGWAGAGLDGLDLGADIARIRGYSTEPPSEPLRVTTVALPAAEEQQSYSARLEAAGGTLPYGWSVASGALPPGVKLDAGGTLSGVASAAGDFAFTARVSDGKGATASQPLFLRVTRGIAPVEIVTTFLPAARVGVGYSVSLQATGGLGSYTWALAGGSLPPGLALNGTGVLAGTPAAAGSWTFTVTAYDAADAGRFASRSLMIEVRPPARPPTVVLTAPAAGAVLTAGSTITVSADAVDSDGTVRRVNFFVNGQSIGSATAAPFAMPWKVPAVGNFNLWAEALDNEGGSGASETVAVTAVAPVEVVTTSVPGGRAGDPYTTALRASGGLGSYTWSVTAGDLPAGLALDASGVLSGIPASSGSFTFTVTAADAGGRSGFRALTLFLRPANQAPAVSISAPVADDVVAANAKLTVSASATDIDGAVQRVDIYANGTLIGSRTAPPWTVEWTPAYAASVSLRAVAIDNEGASASSEVVAITVLNEVVIYANDASAVVGSYQFVTDATAAGGRRLLNPNKRARKISTPLASPGSYIEFTFLAQAGRPYHLWIRGKAEVDGWANDAAFVQFSGAVDAAGVSIYRIGTTAAAVYEVEEGVHADLSGWGWQDTAYGGSAPPIYFAATGPQRIRLQPREDGLSIDQIVISPVTWLEMRPGATKDDTTIVKK